MARNRSYPSDDVTAGEWVYLEARYSATEAEERRQQIGLTIRRLVRKGFDQTRLHRALMVGIDRWERHRQQQMTRQQGNRRNAAIARARKDVDRALASLRGLLPYEPALHEGGRAVQVRVADDEVLFQLRERLLTPVNIEPPTRPRGGRPWDWKQDTDDALRRVRVEAVDRRELIAALGFSSE